MRTYAKVAVLKIDFDSSSLLGIMPWMIICYFFFFFFLVFPKWRKFLSRRVITRLSKSEGTRDRREEEEEEERKVRERERLWLCLSLIDRFSDSSISHFPLFFHLNLKLFVMFLLWHFYTWRLPTYDFFACIFLHKVN